MRRAALSAVVVAGVLAWAPAPPAQAAVGVMVVGKDGTVVERAREVATRTRRVKVGRRRCAVGGRTPLAALVATGARLRVTDTGACGRRTRDAGGLFVTSVAGERNRGNDGWFYKVGRRAGTTGAGSPDGPFGDGRALRTGQRVTWFYCDADPQGGCQRTLEARPDSRTASPGATVRVTVRGYDNDGRGVPVPGGRVTLGEVEAVAGPDGVATLTVPPDATGEQALRAEAPGMIDAFPVEIAIR